MSGVTVSIPLVAKLEKASSQQALDTLARTIAEMLLGDMRERIHEQGKKTDGSQLGSYNNQYLKTRVRKYNRTASKRLGFKNSFYADKAGWAEERYGRVYGLTKEEKLSVVDEVNEWIKAQL